MLLNLSKKKATGILNKWKILGKNQSELTFGKFDDI